MRASELVALLNAEIEKYGDLVVRYSHPSGQTTPLIIATYNEYGNTATEDWPATEIFIH